MVFGRVSVTLMARVQYIERSSTASVNRNILSRGVVCGNTSRFLGGWRGGRCHTTIGRTKTVAEPGSILGLDASSFSAIGCSSNMKGSWRFVKRAMKTLVSPPVVVALGASVLGAGIWGAGNSPLGKYSNKHKQQMSVRSHVGLEGTGKSPVGSPDGTGRLLLISGAASLPHPEKEHRGGEDAYFVHSGGYCLGVADGVGGWAEVGVDPGLYSRELMNHADSFINSVQRVDESVPQQALEDAHSKTRARGSCTACIVCLCGTKIYASNLGDSGFALVRDGLIEYISPQQQHEFNFPYQIGSPDSMSDLPTAAQNLSVHVEAGDAIIVATDGLFDNVYPDEAAGLVGISRRNGESPRIAAQTLAKFARVRAADPRHLSPFAYGAQQLGFQYFGGKMDDITVLVAYVEKDKSEVNEAE